MFVRQEKMKSYSTRSYYKKESHNRKVRFEDEKEHERIFSGRKEKHSNEATEKEEKNIQKPSHSKLKACILPESKIMVGKFLRQAEEKSSRMPSRRLAKETRNESVKNDASCQSRNNKVANKLSPMNEAGVNNRISETMVNGNMSCFNQNVNNSRNISKNQFVNISKEFVARSNTSDKLSSANSGFELSAAKCGNNSSNVNEEISPLSQNNCAYSENTISVMSNAVIDEFNHPCGGYDGQNFKIQFQNENENSNNLSADVYTEQKVNSAYENSVICNSSHVFTHCKSAYESIAFCDFELQDLLHYNVNLMQDEQFIHYAFTLRDKIMQRIDDFKKNVRDELKFLCELSDGTQTEKNQKLITERICHVIKSFLKKPMQTDNLGTSSKESEFCASSSHLISNRPDSNSVRVQDVSRVSNPQAYSYIHENYGSQAFKAVQRYDFPLQSDGKNMDYVMLDKNVQHCDDRLVIERNAHIQDSDNHNAYKNSKVSSTMIDSMGNSTMVEKHVEHNCIAINSKESEYSAEESLFKGFGLSNLLHCNIDAMHGNQLLYYAFALKERILEKLPEFEDLVIKDKLEFMCEITDGSQTEENQKLITERMCNFISEYFETDTSENLQKSPRISFKEKKIDKLN